MVSFALDHLLSLRIYIYCHSETKPHIHPLSPQVDPVSGPVEGGTVVTISGSNLGQRAEDIQNSVTVAGVPCDVIHSRYEVSSRRVAGRRPDQPVSQQPSDCVCL